VSPVQCGASPSSVGDTTSLCVWLSPEERTDAHDQLSGLLFQLISVACVPHCSALFFNTTGFLPRIHACYYLGPLTAPVLFKGMFGYSLDSLGRDEEWRRRCLLGL